LSELKGMGFELNPYDTCVTNKNIDGQQCTIAWYVDDTKISQDSNKVVTRVIRKIKKRFGKMTVTRGKKDVSLGMDVEFKIDGTATIKMREYIKEAIADFGEGIVRQAITPARKNLFDINDDSAALTNTQRDLPQCSGKTVVRVETGKAGHIASHCFPLYVRIMQYRKGLVQAEESAGVPKGYTRQVLDPRGR
jgi:hypothetical protein